ncbi:hypothetical protein ACJU26_05650 [Acidithiobacillus sp. M4-SHS-6]|uniref:hypothetical protein n=1 Tax=Acidithiobacillus sp. M4-SHS-6 TaxID=3383024 RepID=UPI0039BE477F
MSRWGNRGILFVIVALGLAGCATHSEPPARAVKLAYLSHLDHRHFHWPKHHRTILYHLLINTHVEKCEPTGKPDVRACSVYVHVPHVTDHHGVIDMIKGKTHWHLL